MEWQSYEWEFAGEVLAKAVAAAQSEIPVLLSGETGTGHEAVARYIHSHSRRVEEPFESVNCASLPDAVLARRLMGWEKGFDRDAREPFKGLIGLGGVLFLYPIEPIGARSESVLRRLLQTGEYQPLGAAQPLKADVRLVAATNTEPETAVARGERGWATRVGSLESASPPRRARPFSLMLGRVTCVSSTTNWDARWRNPMVVRSRLMIFQAA
ncbi:MAG: sigma-54 factor interaction domain-containing protein [Candidatus Eisenbacteria bacterium]|uniref:Sigma-54 factor interaction domain-containing protein n=1 Tax=Eiseniibacteriota bacterium TaxID=2212470 RepID=A0A538TLT3_UNCEI|nr:MAG: sigma-54 factor interaction domain-containing protein [Candidatus Eisenbacteria bacterium]